MHPYSNDTGRRQQTAIAACASIGLLAAFGLSAICSFLNIYPPWWLDMPAAFGCFGIIWMIYDKWGWRIKIGPTSISGIPDLSGEWLGDILSDYNNGTSIPAKMKIRQTSTRILIVMTTESSLSHSNMASLCSAEGADQGLRYAYSNRPRALTSSSMAQHQGTAHLRPIEGNAIGLEGDYESNRYRRTHGRIQFKRAGKPKE